MTNPLQRDLQNRKMKLPALLFVSLSVAAFRSGEENKPLSSEENKWNLTDPLRLPALSASLNSAEEDGVAAQHGEEAF